MSHITKPSLTNSTKSKKNSSPTWWPDLTTFYHFGKKIRSILQFFVGSIKINQSFALTLATFHCCKWQDIEKDSSHLVTLLNNHYFKVSFCRRLLAQTGLWIVWHHRTRFQKWNCEIMSWPIHGIGRWRLVIPFVLSHLMN